GLLDLSNDLRDPLGGHVSESDDACVHVLLLVDRLARAHRPRLGESLMRLRRQAVAPGSHPIRACREPRPGRPLPRESRSDLKAHLSSRPCPRRAPGVGSLTHAQPPARPAKEGPDAAKLRLHAAPATFV